MEILGQLNYDYKCLKCMIAGLMMVNRVTLVTAADVTGTGLHEYLMQIQSYNHSTENTKKGFYLLSVPLIGQGRRKAGANPS